MGLLVCFAYVFSFKPAFNAVVLHHQLENEQSDDHNGDLAFSQLEKKNGFYQQVLSAYQVKKEERENRLWQTISAISVAKAVEISYNPTTQVLLDSSLVKLGVVNQQFSFKGDYFQLVSLLDTLSKSKGIGELTELKLGLKKEERQGSNHILNLQQMNLIAVER